MRPAHLRAAVTLVVGALVLPALARPPGDVSPPPPEALSADAPSAPLHHVPLPGSGALIEAAGDWRGANAAVAAFPRGHADMVRWEAAQPQAAPLPAVPFQALPSSSAPAPRQGHSHHGRRP